MGEARIMFCAVALLPLEPAHAQRHVEQMPVDNNNITLSVLRTI